MDERDFKAMNEIADTSNLLQVISTNCVNSNWVASWLIIDEEEDT